MLETILGFLRKWIPPVMIVLCIITALITFITGLVSGPFTVGLLWTFAALYWAGETLEQWRK